MLRAARRRAGLSQRELARRAGVPQSTVGRIEAGLADPKAATLRRLLRECGGELQLVAALGMGVDRSQIRERLARTPAERLRDVVLAAAAVGRIRGAARKRR